MISDPCPECPTSGPIPRIDHYFGPSSASLIAFQPASLKEYNMAKKALCLSGGATRGTFQIGAIKCLYEVYGFRPDLITGTSVGAINAIKLACAPPPVVNDSAAILSAVTGGMIDPQLAQMRSLEQFWLTRNGRKDFFSIKPVFRGTLVDDKLREDANPGIPLGTEIDLANATLFAPMFSVMALDLVGAAIATYEIQKIKDLIRFLSVEDSVADLTPVRKMLRDPTNINIGDPSDMPPFTNNLMNGTPLYMAMVALETGKLRYATNKAEFYERDGVTPVVTALLDGDVDMALDENLLPLPKTRRDKIKFAISKYKAAVNQMTAYHPELSDEATPLGRKAELVAATERERERGNYWAKAALQQIKGVTVKTVIRDMGGMPDPIIGALASASLPVLLDPPEVGVERYVDGGLREIIPIEIVLNKNVTQIVGILCSTPELPLSDSKKNVGVIEVGLRAATEIAINEVTVGDVVTAAASGIDTRIIAPSIDVHSGMDLKPSLIEISMDFGWLRAVDEMQPVLVSDEREIFRRTSETLTRLRMKCLEIERRVATNDLRIAEGQKWDYFELRVNRWAIMHVTAQRTALGLPPHPSQATWPTDWEREFRGNGPFQFPSAWSSLEVRALDNTLLQLLWPASSPSGFNPDIGSIEDAGSDRVYWMVRGAIFEDTSGSPLSAPLANVVMPSGLHQFLPLIPSGSQLMAETQAQGIIVLVIGGKKYASPTPEWIAAAGLNGATVAIVPQGGLMQIPDGGIPFFLGSLTVVDAHDVTLSSLFVERVENSETVLEVAIHNRSTTDTLTGISIEPTGFGPAQDITVEDFRPTLAPNTIDSFTLRLHPTASGVFDGSLQINSSDTLVPHSVVGFRFTVLPLGDMAELQFSPTPFVISAPVNSTSSYSMLTVTNNGGVVPATISASFEPASIQSLFNTGVYLTASSFSLGNPVQIPIFFFPTAAGLFNAELVLTASGMTSTNHPYERTFRIPIVGNAGASIIRLLTRKPMARDFRPVSFGGFTRPGPVLDGPQTTVALDLGTIQPPVNDVGSVFILNQGTLALEIPTMLGSNASPTNGQTFPIRIEPEAWVEVQLDFGMYYASAIGVFSETLRILSNDPVTPEAHVVLRGAVPGTKASMVPEFINFETVGLNTAAQRTTDVHNSGTVDLHINKVAWRAGTDFAVVQPPTLPCLVAAGTNMTLNIEFGPAATQGFFGDNLVLGTSEGISISLGVQARTS